MPAMTSRILRPFILLFAFLLMPAAAPAASFDCAKAAKPDETAICTTPELSALDSEMGGLWFAFRKVPMLMGSNGARMDDAQAFLQQRAACAGDIACLRKLYHARIAVLKEGITQAMDNFFQLQNADPAVAPWSVTTLPPAIARIVASYADDCTKLGGKLAERADMPKLMTGDLDGDGTPDFVLDPSPLQCSAAATAYCGNGGCRISVALSDDDYKKPMEILGGEPTLALREAGAVLDIWVDGVNCNLSDRKQACWASYAWKDGALKPTYASRPLEK